MKSMAELKFISEKLCGYFDNDDDEFEISAQPTTLDGGDEIDPLDAFMFGVEEQVKQQATVVSTHELPEIVSGRDEYEYPEYEDRAHEDLHDDDGNNLEYDSDGNFVSKTLKVHVEPLPPVDHKQIHYNSFQKNFYKESKSLALMSDLEVSEYQQELEVALMGTPAYRPIKRFEDAGFESKLLKEIQKAGFEKPTPIQAQTLPIVMSGRDLIGLAKTGSGKTMSYVWPMIVHIMHQPQMQIGDGPIGIILAPTRELAAQIFAETKKFSAAYNIGVCAIFGGAGKYEMVKALKLAPEIVVATPGRFIELVKTKATNFKRCTIVVLDEADRMFDMGFEYQMRSIVTSIRPDRQTLLFSATMKKKVEGFAREILTNPVRVVVGTIGQANPDIQQVTEVFCSNDAEEKWRWLARNADDYVANGKLLIFVSSKAATEELCERLKHHFQQRQLDIGVDCLHGDRDQADRGNVMRRFARSISTHSSSSSTDLVILVATDIASRGLDVKDIRTVINYTPAKNIETHVHRIGRTGRMGVDGIVPGTAYTLLSPQDSNFAGDLVTNLRVSEQPVSDALLRLAEQSASFMSRKRGGAGGAGGRGSGAGLGLGFSGSAKAMTSAMAADNTVSKSMSFVAGMSSSLVAKCMSSSSSKTDASKTASVSSFSHTSTSDMAANKYMDGHSMGRGAHLTQPAWKADVVPSSSSSTSNNETCFGEPVKPRKSRFSAAEPVDPTLLSAPPPLPTHQFQDTVFATNAPVMKGFVRGSQSAAMLSSVSQQPQQAASLTSIAPLTSVPISLNSQPTATQRKKTRWDV